MDIHDGIYMISTEEVVKRLYQWGELSKKVADLEYKYNTEIEFSFFLHYLFYGGEYAFTWGSEKYKNYSQIDL